MLSSIYNHNCKLCPLHKVPGRTCLSGNGNLKQPRILIVGDGPSKQESEHGRAFADERGRLLIEALEEVGIPIGDDGEVFATYAVKCCPSGKIKLKDAKTCADTYLQKEIELLRPELIITLGKVAQYCVLGSNTPISKTHGKMFILTRTDAAGNEWTTKVMSVEHPFSILSTPAKLEPWLADLRRAKVTFYSQGDPYWNPSKLDRFDFRIIGSIRQFKEVARELIAKHRGAYLAIDIEASGVDEDINNDDFKVYSLQFGVVDLEDKEMNDSAPVYYLPLQSSCFDAGKHPDRWLDWFTSIIPLLNRFLSPDYFKVVGHNIKYDLKGLRRIGVNEAYAAYDTMLLWSVAHGEAPMSLKEISYQVSDLGGYEKAMNEYAQEHGNYDAPLDIALPYSCIDIVITRHLMYEMFTTIMQETRVT